MRQLKLVLRTPEGIFFETEATLVRVNQTDGSRAFMAMHEDCLGEIVRGVCKYIDENEETVRFVTGNGYFSVSKGVVTINSSFIVFGDSYEKAIESSKSSAAEFRKRYVRSRQEYTQSKAEVAKALSGKKDDAD